MEVLAIVGDSRLGEQWPWLRQLGHALHRLTPFLALLGMALSLLHQSSLGVLGNVVAASYFPSIVEIGVAVGIVTYALLGFTLGARYLAIYPRAGKAD